MTRLLNLKSAMFKCIIIREWIENGEFDKADKIIVVGTKFQAAMVKGLFKGIDDKRIYCYKKSEIIYKHYNKIKWIIFNKNMIKKFPQNDCNVLIMPKT